MMLPVTFLPHNSLEETIFLTHVQIAIETPPRCHRRPRYVVTENNAL